MSHNVKARRQLETLIQSWTDKQVENLIGMYANSKQNKLMVHLGNKNRVKRNKNNGIIIMVSCFIIIIDLISKDHLGALKQFSKNKPKTKTTKKQMHREIVGQVFEMCETYPIINVVITETKQKKGTSFKSSHSHFSCSTRCHVDRATDTLLEDFPPDSPLSLISSLAHTPYAIPHITP